MLGFDKNHGRDRCAALIRARAALEALGDKATRAGSWGWEVTDCGDPISVEWFAAHKGQELEIVSEYGEVDGECIKRPKCPCCDQPFRCHKPENHPGDCDPRFRPERSRL